MSKRRDIYKLIDDNVENKSVANHIKEYISNQAETIKKTDKKLTKKKFRIHQGWRRYY